MEHNMHQLQQATEAAMYQASQKNFDGVQNEGAYQAAERCGYDRTSNIGQFFMCVYVQYAFN